MVKKIIQVIPHLFSVDGVSQIVLDYSSMFDTNNIPNLIFGLSYDDDIEFDLNRWHNIEKINNYLNDDTLLLFHFAMPTPLTPIVSKLNCKKVLIYHNITPPKYFKGLANLRIKLTVIKGYIQLFYLSKYFEYGWGVSDYNTIQLKKAGFKNTSTATPPFTYSNIAIDSDIKKNNIKNILFVGRIAPNKKQEDIIKAFYYYHKINPKSELTLVGNYNSFPKYKYKLDKLVKKFDIPVTFTGSVSNKELVSYYTNADLFLCMSEHEGFCIPLIEAMYFGIPVIAFNSSAVPETVGNAGVIFNKKKYFSVGNIINDVLNDSILLEKLKLNGKKRVEYYNTKNTSKRLLKLIETIE